MDKKNQVLAESSGEKPLNGKDLKRAWERFFESECDMLRELKVKIDDKATAKIWKRWNLMPLTKKREWVWVGSKQEANKGDVGLRGRSSSKRKLKRACERFLKSECDSMRELGEKIDDEVKSDIQQQWDLMPLTEKCKWIGYGDEREGTGDTESSANSKFAFMCRQHKFATVVTGFNKTKIDAAYDTGLGNLLNLKCERLDVNLISWLLGAVDPEDRVLNVHGQKYPVGLKEFQEVMGIIDGQKDVCFIDNGSDITELYAHYCDWSNDRHVIPWKTLEHDLKGDDVGDNFRRSFALFSIGTVICPTSRCLINPSFLYSVIKVDEIKMKKWATYSMNVLMEGIQKFKYRKLKTLTGCLIFLQLFYLQKVATTGVCTNINQLHILTSNENVTKKTRPFLNDTFDGDRNEEVNIENGGANEKSPIPETCVLRASNQNPFGQHQNELRQTDNEGGAKKKSTATETSHKDMDADFLEQLQVEVRQVWEKVQGLRAYCDPLLADMMAGMAKLTSAVSSLTDVVSNMQRESKSQEGSGHTLKWRKGLTVLGSNDEERRSVDGLSGKDSFMWDMLLNDALQRQVEFQGHLNGQFEEQRTVQTRLEMQVKDLQKVVEEQQQQILLSGTYKDSDTISLAGDKRKLSQRVSYPDGPAHPSSSQKRLRQIAELEDGIQPPTLVLKTEQNDF